MTTIQENKRSLSTCSIHRLEQYLLAGSDYLRVPLEATSMSGVSPGSSGRGRSRRRREISRGLVARSEEGEGRRQTSRLKGGWPFRCQN